MIANRKHRHSTVVLFGLLACICASAEIPSIGGLADDHIVPLVLSDGIVINIPQRRLFYFEQGALVAHYPVAAGRPSWPTCTGDFHVDEKRKDPTWYVPKSIQEEMRRAGKPVVTRVAPGPANPLGKHWPGISDIDCGIHGTNAPESIPRLVTHGCIRMLPDDIAALFPRVAVGMAVKIIYQAVLVLPIDNEQIYLEVHSDSYRRQATGWKW